jgi:nitrogen regulatory protein PII
MDLHPRKRIEIVLEAPALHRLTSALDAVQVTGYTILPVLAGRGEGGTWSRDGLVGAAGQMVMVICITDARRAEAVLERVMALLARQIGIVSVSDVMVVRADRF